MADVRDDLTNFPIFSDFSPSEREQIKPLLERCAFSKGDVILREGKSTQFLWIVAGGRCEVFKMNGHGAEQQLAVLEPGAVFGEMSFFEPAPHSASVRTLCNCEVVRMSPEKFDQLQKQCPEAAYKLARRIISVLAQRLRKMDDWTAELVDRPETPRQREEWLEFRAKLYSDWQF